jgi:hypothetical protein
MGSAYVVRPELVEAQADEYHTHARKQPHCVAQAEYAFIIAKAEHGDGRQTQEQASILPIVPIEVGHLVWAVVRLQPQFATTDRRGSCTRSLMSASAANALHVQTRLLHC